MGKRAGRVAILCALLTGLAGQAAWATDGGEVCPDTLAAAIPPRAAPAMDAAAFVQRAAGMGEAAREAAIRDELLAGNLPPFLRRLKPVTLRGLGADGRAVEVTLCVMPDYLAIGSDDDFLRTPIGLPTALAVAGRLGFMLPTARMVDAIYEQAELRLRPQPMPPTAAMRSTGYFQTHHRRIRAQRLAAGAPLGVLIAGQKKDLVLSERLRRRPGRVAIYGWHQAPGRPIQPLSTVHGARYADYSHGVRLVSTTAYLDGRRHDLAALLADPQIAPILSDEGPLGEVVAALATR